MIEEKIKKLNKDSLQKLMLEMIELLSVEQRQKLEDKIEKYGEKSQIEKEIVKKRISQEYVNEKNNQIEKWMDQIEEGDLYLDGREYEDYSDDYWDRDWITEYEDNQGIGKMFEQVVQFAKECVENQYYQDAICLYDRIWDMEICVSEEYGEILESVDVGVLKEEKIIHVDLKEIALLTLYADYQVQKPEERAQDLYCYFEAYDSFSSIHLDEMFKVGEERLEETDQFWKDWIALLEEKSGSVSARLLQEAIIYYEGVDGFATLAARNCKNHPSLYLAAVEEFAKNHEYLQMEQVGKEAMEKIDKKLTIRAKIAMKAAYASSCIAHTEELMRFCWESFCSDTTVRSFLRLFGLKEMAETYGMRGKEIVIEKKTGTSTSSFYTSYDAELAENVISEYEYKELCFYMGDFDKVKEFSKNPSSSLGWSTSFIQYGIRLFLLYLYKNPIPSKAILSLSKYVGFFESDDEYRVKFEEEILQESSENKTSLFWDYFQRWKQYFPMEEQEQEKYLKWAEAITYKRADAIVGGQHRKQYGEVAILLGAVAEVKESMGYHRAKQEIFAEYKRKFPRHSSFQAAMKLYFN